MRAGLLALDVAAVREDLAHSPARIERRVHRHISRAAVTELENALAPKGACCFIYGPSRMWWNWQTRYFEVVVPQGVQVQVLLCAPFFLRKLMAFSTPA